MLWLVLCLTEEDIISFLMPELGKCAWGEVGHSEMKGSGPHIKQALIAQ